jgi:hypothetical protein
MADFDISAIFPFVMPSTPGVTTSDLKRAIVGAARELTRKARLWSVQLAPVYADGTTPDVALVLPTGAELVKVEGWGLGGVQRRMLTLDEAVAEGLEPNSFDTGVFFDGPDGGSDGLLTAPVAYVTDPVTPILRVLPLQTDTTLAIVARAHLTLQEGATTFPSALTPHMRLIGQGATYMLQLLPEKGYSNPGQASINKDLFDVGVGRLVLRAGRAYGAGTTRRRPRNY